MLFLCPQHLEIFQMKRTILVCALVSILAACGHNTQQQAQVIPAQQVAQQPQVIEQAPPQIIQDQPQIIQPAPQVIVQQPPVIVQQDNSGAALATGMALGMMVGGGTTHVVHHYVPAPSYYSRPSTTMITKTTSYRPHPSGFGTVRTTTTRITRR